jgi:acetyltransferase
MSVPDYHDVLEVDGTAVTIRAMRPIDRDIEARFVAELSPASRYNRFHAPLKVLGPGMLERFTSLHYPDEMALIATVQEAAGERQVGVARYARFANTDRAEVAVVVADAWQGKGIGTRLLLDLRALAIEAGIRHLEVSVLPGNTRMLRLARLLGFTLKPARAGDVQSLELGKDL